MAVYDRMLTQELKKMAFRNHVDRARIGEASLHRWIAQPQMGAYASVVTSFFTLVL